MRLIIIFCAEYVYLAVAIGWMIALKFLKPSLGVKFVICTVVAGALAYILALVTSHLHYEARPFVAEGITPLVKHGTDNGFPSDHALLTMTLTAVVWFFNRNIAKWMLLATILVGVGRVAALLHSPQQIVAGWLLGIVSASVAYAVLKMVKSVRRPAK